MGEDSIQFTKKEKGRIMDSIKSRRFDSDEMYELYEKISEWYSE